MKIIVPKQIELYCRKNTTPESQLLHELVNETYASTAYPEMQVGHLEGAFLKMLIRLIRAKRVLELGTFTGYSSLVMAQALPEDGKLITCDIDPESTEIAKRYWKLVFIDADKKNYINYWELCVQKTRSGGLLVIDNVLWGGGALEPEDETDRAIAEFNKHVYSDKRVEVVMLPLRDGVTLAWKL
jgi:caffeoyl-CoA O-methyltransferase